MLRILLPVTIGCSLLFTQSAEQSKPASEVATSTIADELIASQVPPAESLKVYDIKHGSVNEIANTLAAINTLGVQIIDETSSQLHILADADRHSEVKQLLTKLDVPAETARAGDSSDDAGTTQLQVTVAWIHKDWSEQLDEHPESKKKLQAIYEDVDLKPLGGEIGKAAPKLLFPDSVASVFEHPEGLQLLNQLEHIGVIENAEVIQTSDDKESSDPATQKFEVPNFYYPSVRSRTSRVKNPFSKLKGEWSLRTGGPSNVDGAVVAFAEYSQFVETEWPTKEQTKSRVQVKREQYGKQFVLNDGELAVLRWLGPKWVDPTSAYRKLLGSGAAEGAVGGLVSLGSKDADDNYRRLQTAFPVIMLINSGDELAQKEPSIRAEWNRPLRADQLEEVEYRAQPLGAVVQAEAQPKDVRTNSQSKAAMKQFAMFDLKHVSADEFSTTIQKMFPDRSMQFVTDQRTNHLFLTADGESIGIVGELLEILDVPRKSETATVSQTSNLNLQPFGPNFTKKASGQSTVNQTPQTLDFDALKKTVTQEFELRQKMHLKEISFLKSRLEDLEERVRRKDRLKNQIIEQRVKSLLSAPEDQ